MALALGVIAFADIRRSGRGGTGRAVFGIVTGLIGTIILAIGLISATTQG